MTKEQVLNSIALKKRFCKNCNLPIDLFDEPYFSERLEILDFQFDCVRKFNEFCVEMEKFEDEQVYFQYYNTIKESVINMIKANSDFNKFLKDDFNEVNLLSHTAEVGNNNLYTEDNAGKSFISIDMKQANFSALKHYSPNIFKGFGSWEDYIGSFTNNEHIKNSKYIRQVILGACNPKRQVQYEKYLMTLLYNHIKKSLGEEVDVFSIGNDEIIIFAVSLKCSIEKLKEIIADCPDDIGSLVRLEVFDLDKIGDVGWIKNIYDETDGTVIDKVEFKGVNKEIYHQVLKHYRKQPIAENDLVFRYNGQLAKFLKEVQNPWE